MNNPTCLHCGKDLPNGRKGRKFCDRSCSAKFRWANVDFRNKVIPKCIQTLPNARTVRWKRWHALHANDRKPSREDWFAYQTKMSKLWREAKGKTSPVRPNMGKNPIRMKTLGQILKEEKG